MGLKCLMVQGGRRGRSIVSPTMRFWIPGRTTPSLFAHGILNSRASPPNLPMRFHAAFVPRFFSSKHKSGQRSKNQTNPQKEPQYHEMRPSDLVIAARKLAKTPNLPNTLKLQEILHVVKSQKYVYKKMNRIMLSGFLWALATTRIRDEEFFRDTTIAFLSDRHMRKLRLRETSDMAIALALNGTYDQKIFSRAFVLVKKPTRFKTIRNRALADVTYAHALLNITDTDVFKFIPTYITDKRYIILPTLTFEELARILYSYQMMGISDNDVVEMFEQASPCILDLLSRKTQDVRHTSMILKAYAFVGVEDIELFRSAYDRLVKIVSKNGSIDGIHMALEAATKTQFDVGELFADVSRLLLETRQWEHWRSEDISKLVKAFENTGIQDESLISAASQILLNREGTIESKMPESDQNDSDQDTK